MAAGRDSSELMKIQAGLQAEALELRAELGLDDLLQTAGEPVLVGSAALGLMAWRDLDITVACETLDHHVVLTVVTELGRMPSVREVSFRDDTGHWNTDPNYPDGLFVGVDCVSSRQERWSLDLWFVDEPERQPDLAHLKNLQPRLTDETREAILAIKTAWCQRREYGVSVTSFGIYQAVLDDGIRTLEEFNARLSENGD